MLAMHETHAAPALPSGAPARLDRFLQSHRVLTAAIHGLGGQGVVYLTRLLAQALQLRFPRTASTETRGIAQRRAPVKAVVRAGAEIRSAAAPETLVNLVVALEASEALRAAPVLRPGCDCLLSDLSFPSSIGTQPILSPDEIRSLLEERGVRVLPLQVHDWLKRHRAGDALVSTIAFGALVSLLGLPLPHCRDLLLHSLADKQREQGEEAFHWGVLQMSPPVPAARRASLPAAAPERRLPVVPALA